VVLSALFLDLDLCHVFNKPSKVSWSDAPRGAKAKILKRSESLSPSAAYATRHGARFVHVLAQDVPAGAPAEALLARLMARYTEAGLPGDQACSHWTRLYRHPKVTLDDGTQTWTEPWYWFEDYLDDDERVLIPEPEDLIPPPIEERRESAAIGSRPTDEECHVLLHDPVASSGLTAVGR